MNVEGLWAFATGSADEPQNMINSGVVVLETGRVLGGDSAVAYVGTYRARADGIEGEVRTFQYNPALEVVNVFGRSGDEIDQIVGFVATRDGEWMRGHLWPVDDQSSRLPMTMRFLHDLPG